MGKFKSCTDKEREIIEGFPVLSESDVTQVNDLFAHYVFYRREKKGLRLWTSCCHKEGVLLPFAARTYSTEEIVLMDAEHGEEVQCPFCRRRAEKKCIGKIRRGANLAGWQSVLILHNRGDALYAQAFYARKTYDAKRDGDRILSAVPELRFLAAYRFQDGCAMQIEKEYYSGEYYCQYERDMLKRKKRVNDPFGEPYELIGAPLLQEGFAKYSQYDQWRGAAQRLHRRLISYMTVYAIYPRQLEMLVKMGMDRAVTDMVCDRTKNFGTITWEERDPRRAFKLSGQDAKTMRESDVRGDELFETIGYLHDLQRAGETLSLRELIEDEAGAQLVRLLQAAKQEGKYKGIFRRCEVLGVKPSRLCRYLDKIVGYRCGGMGYYSIGQAMRLWFDTLAMAEELGFDVSDSAVAFPSSLENKHEEYVELINEKEEGVRRETERERQKTAREMERLLNKKYSLELNGLIIRAPKDAKEIQAEGAALKHCVAGYAQRHMSRGTTILFLREAKNPERPLCTIEMDGKKLVQIHGYKNEGIHSAQGRFAPDPREVYRETLDIWLDWIKGGSKRDKNKAPILPKKKEVETA